MTDESFQKMYVNNFFDSSFIDFFLSLFFVFIRQ